MLIEINLLPAKKKKSKLFLAMIGIISVFAFGLLTIFIAGHFKNNEFKQIKQELTNITQLRETLEMSAAELINDSESSSKLLSDAIAWSESRQLPATPLLKHMVERLPERGFFQSVSYVSDQTLQVNIQFDTSREGAYYLSELKASDWIDSAAILSVATSVQGTESNAETLLETEDALPRYLVQYEIVFDKKAVTSALEQEAKNNE